MWIGEEWQWRPSCSRGPSHEVKVPDVFIWVVKRGDDGEVETPIIPPTAGKILVIREDGSTDTFFNDPLGR